MNLREYYERFYQKHNGRHKYLRKSHHAKKHVSEDELTRITWRDYKKIKKDKFKAPYSYSSNICGCKFYKKFTNSRYRTKMKVDLKKICYTRYSSGWWESRDYLDNMNGSWVYNYEQNDWDDFNIEEHKSYSRPYWIC